jgi:TRAP-type uncharacterized transport system fused permease subunit
MTGAYVAAGIAKADPVETGFVAMRLGIIVFLLPFAFVYDPGLLLIGSNVGESVLHISACTIGILFWAYGLEGYFRKPLGVVPRVLLMVSGVMLIWPDIWLSLAGLVIGSLVILSMVKETGFRRNRKTEIDG